MQHHLAPLLRQAARPTLALGLSLAALACSGQADIGDNSHAATLCDPSACTGPAPLSPSYQCADGSIAGPACVEDSGGTCGWQILECPGACTAAECGPAPGVPNWTCPDGTIAGPSCGADPATGACGWQIVSCPGAATCQWDDCPSPAPGAPNFQCPDGTIGGPACASDPATGACGWTFVECPA